MRLRAVLVLALAVLGSGLVQAQEPVLTVASFAVSPGKVKDFLDLVKKYDQPVFEKLMAEGAVLAWGVDTPVYHQPGQSGLELWWTSPDMGAQDKVFAAFEELEKTMAAEDEKAAKVAKAAGRKPPKTIVERLMEATDLSKHQDFVYRVQAINGRPAGKGALPYFWATTARVLPGKAGAFRAAWDRFIKPVYDKLLADGAILGYGLATEELKTTDAFTHVGWATLPNLAAREKVRAAFNAASEAERQQRTEEFLKVLDATASRNLLMRSLMYDAGGN